MSFLFYFELRNGGWDSGEGLGYEVPQLWWVTGLSFPVLLRILIWIESWMETNRIEIYRCSFISFFFFEIMVKFIHGVLTIIYIFSLIMSWWLECSLISLDFNTVWIAFEGVFIKLWHVLNNFVTLFAVLYCCFLIFYKLLLLFGLVADFCCCHICYKWRLLGGLCVVIAMLKILGYWFCCTRYGWSFLRFIGYFSLLYLYQGLVDLLVLVCYLLGWFFLIGYSAFGLTGGGYWSGCILGFWFLGVVGWLNLVISCRNYLNLGILGL